MAFSRAVIMPALFSMESSAMLYSWRSFARSSIFMLASRLRMSPLPPWALDVLDIGLGEKEQGRAEEKKRREEEKEKEEKEKNEEEKEKEEKEEEEEKPGKKKKKKEIKKERKKEEEEEEEGFRVLTMLGAKRNRGLEG